MNIVRHKTFTTIKSQHDEQTNQALLKRLKRISVIGGKKTLPPEQPDKDVGHNTLSFNTVDKIIERHLEDPLVWNTSVLGRIYKVPEDYCEAIVEYVKPMLFFISNKMDEPERMLKQKFVYDASRLKSDENYLVIYKRIIFPNSDKQELPTLALQETPEVEKLERSLSEKQDQQRFNV